MRETYDFPSIDKTYREAMDLLNEARRFVSFHQASANDNGDSFDRFVITSKTSCLVSHLTNVMSWILWQKAANAGEVSASKACRMGDKHLKPEIFNHPANLFDVDLPPTLERLIGRAGMLHARVNRLSQMIH